MRQRWDLGVLSWCAAGLSLVLAACGTLQVYPWQGTACTVETQNASAAVLTQDTSLNDRCFASASDGENALRVDAGNAVLHRVLVQKSGGDRQGRTNAALYIAGGASAELSQVSITSSVPGYGVYAQGDGSDLKLTECAITTTADSADGIYNAGDGTLSARDLTVTTSGNEASPLRVQGGSVQIQGGTYTSGGYAAPAVYAAASVTARQADLCSNNAPVVQLDLGAALLLENCTLSGGTAADGQESGDSAVIVRPDSQLSDTGVELSITGGSLTARDDLFEVENAHWTLHLSQVELIAPEYAALLLVHDGAQAELTAENQTMRGTADVDATSSLVLTLCRGSEFTGKIDMESGALVRVQLQKGSRWNLTGDSTLSELQNDGEILFNGYAVTLADGTVLRG